MALKNDVKIRPPLATGKGEIDLLVAAPESMVRPAPQLILPTAGRPQRVVGGQCERGSWPNPAM